MPKGARGGLNIDYLFDYDDDDDDDDDDELIHILYLVI
jgi:hypothetical protein